LSCARSNARCVPPAANLEPSGNQRRAEREQHQPHAIPGMRARPTGQRPASKGRPRHESTDSPVATSQRLGDWVERGPGLQRRPATWFETRASVRQRSLVPILARWRTGNGVMKLPDGCVHAVPFRPFNEHHVPPPQRNRSPVCAAPDRGRRACPDRLCLESGTPKRAAWQAPPRHWIRGRLMVRRWNHEKCSLPGGHHGSMVGGKKVQAPHRRDPVNRNSSTILLPASSAQKARPAGRCGPVFFSNFQQRKIVPHRRLPSV